MAYWKPDVVFETPCPKCDAAVEFFKDETSGRCPRCGHRFKNPRISFDCAKWCVCAEECLGSVPEGSLPVNPSEGALAIRLIQAVKQEFAADQARIGHALMVFQHARELLSKQGGDPRIVLAAALLLDLSTPNPKPASDSGGPPIAQTDSTTRARRIMEGIGFDEGTVDCVCHLMDRHREGKELDTIEFKIVSDADMLEKLAAEKRAGQSEELQEMVGSRLKTGAGKARARSLLQISPGTPDRAGG